MTNPAAHPVLVINDWTIRKEFYADGPRLFTWVAEREFPGIRRREDFPRRRDAVAWARSHP